MVLMEFSQSGHGWTQYQSCISVNSGWQGHSDYGAPSASVTSPVGCFGMCGRVRRFGMPGESVPFRQPRATNAQTQECQEAHEHQGEEPPGQVPLWLGGSNHSESWQRPQGGVALQDMPAREEVFGPG